MLPAAASMQLHEEDREGVVYGSPQHVAINLEVGMHETVSHSDYRVLRNLGRGSGVILSGRR
jgi:hypothetical protein